MKGAENPTESVNGMPVVPPLRILCADDDEVSRRLLQILLTRGGHCVHCVNDGFAALFAIARHSDGYDLLITDHEMPRIDGLELVNQLRQRGFSVPIIVVSGCLDGPLRRSYRDLGVDAVVDKPFDCARLLALVNSCAARSAG